MLPTLETIRKLRDEKREKQIVPDHVLLSELTKEILIQMRNELNQLKDAGFIKATKTVNERAIILID